MHMKLFPRIGEFRCNASTISPPTSFMPKSILPISNTNFTSHYISTATSSNGSRSSYGRFHVAGRWGKTSYRSRPLC